MSLIKPLGVKGLMVFEGWFTRCPTSLVYHSRQHKIKHQRFWSVFSCLATLYCSEAVFGKPLVCMPQVALFYQPEILFALCVNESTIYSVYFIYVCLSEWGHKKWVSKCVGGVISLVCTVFVQFFPWQQTACTGRAEGNAALSAKANKGSECVFVCVHVCVCDSVSAVCFRQMCRPWYTFFFLLHILNLFLHKCHIHPMYSCDSSAFCLWILCLMSKDCE